MKINKSYLCTRNCYDGNSPTWIVVHQTGNNKVGADAKAHALSLFNGNINGMSWHFVVDDKSAYQNLPINKGAWHVGVNYGGRLFGTVNNRNSICVESCIQAGYNANNAFNNTVEVVKQLMAEYNIDADHVVSHYDVCAKNCPQQIREAGKWTAFKAALTDLQIKVGGKYKLLVNIYFRKTPSGEYVKWKELSESAKKKSTKKSKSKLKKGNTVQALEVKTQSNGNIWIRIKNGWLCVKYKGKYRVK